MPNWEDRAACRGLVDAPDFDKDNHPFFPILEVGHNKPPEVEEVIDAYCRRCPVVKDCAGYAIEMNEHRGIWAGLYFDTTESIQSARRQLLDIVAKEESAA